MIIKIADRAELKRIEELSNRVFKRTGKSIFARYPLVYDEYNRKHINIVKEDNDIVSDVNWYMVNVKCNNSIITGGCIGGVCTDEKARGKGYAQELLKAAFEQMRYENISVCFISGTRGLYTRNGAYLVGKEYIAEFNEKKLSDDVSRLKGDDIIDKADLICRCHNRRNTRFLRNFRDTYEWLEGIVKDENNYELFFNDNAFVLSVCDGGDSIELFDYAGREEDVRTIINHISAVHDKSVKGVVNRNDKYLIKAADVVKNQYYRGTVKIINIKLLFEQLSDRFCNMPMPDIKFLNTGMYEIKTEGKIYHITEDNLYKMIFGTDEPMENLFEENEYPKEFKKAFPIVLPNINGIDGI